MYMELSPYVQSILAIVEPEILSSHQELINACPSYAGICQRGYSDRLSVTSLADIEAINKIYRDRDDLNAQGGKYEVDHIQPLFKGGLHCIDNLQILEYKEHRAKSGQERRV